MNLYSPEMDVLKDRLDRKRRACIKNLKKQIRRFLKKKIGGKYLVKVYKDSIDSLKFLKGYIFDYEHEKPNELFEFYHDLAREKPCGPRDMGRLLNVVISSGIPFLEYHICHIFGIFFLKHKVGTFYEVNKLDTSTENQLANILAKNGVVVKILNIFSRRNGFPFPWILDEVHRICVQRVCLSGLYYHFNRSFVRKKILESKKAVQRFISHLSSSLFLRTDSDLESEGEKLLLSKTKSEKVMETVLRNKRNFHGFPKEKLYGRRYLLKRRDASGMVLISFLNYVNSKEVFLRTCEFLDRKSPKEVMESHIFFIVQLSTMFSHLMNPKTPEEGGVQLGSQRRINNPYGRPVASLLFRLLEFPEGNLYGFFGHGSILGSATMLLCLDFEYDDFVKNFPDPQRVIEMIGVFCRIPETSYVTKCLMENMILASHESCAFLRECGYFPNGMMPRDVILDRIIRDRGWDQVLDDSEYNRFRKYGCECGDECSSSIFTNRLVISTVSFDGSFSIGEPVDGIVTRQIHQNLIEKGSISRDEVLRIQKRNNGEGYSACKKKKKKKKNGRSETIDLMRPVVFSRCDVCGRHGDVYKCGRCRSRYYCSQGCQKKDWRGNHSKVCDAKKKKKKKRNMMCKGCGGGNNCVKKLMVCSRCKVTHYCSVECQRSDWKFHKNECKRVRNDV